MIQPTSYLGRFAPSPTGPLHLGSLVAAMASYVDARAHQGQWILRIEDVDQPRCSIKAERTIRTQLDAYGFHADGEIVRQSERTTHYENALQSLIKSGDAYACRCTRKSLEAALRNADGEVIYPGYCRDLAHAFDDPHISIRCKITPETSNTFEDRAAGTLTQNLSRDVGDFVIRRADGLHAYQLAVVVDDAAQGITHIVRGADLLSNTARQIYLQHRLGFSTPPYLHVPIVTNARGEKLSKQTQALAISTAADDVLPTLHAAWALLGQSPLADVDNVAAFWRAAAECWSVNALRGVSALALSSLSLSPPLQRVG